MVPNYAYTLFPHIYFSSYTVYTDPPIFLSSHPPILLSAYPSIHLSCYLLILLSTYPAFYLSSHPPILLSTYPSIHRSCYLLILLSTYPAIYLSSYPPILYPSSTCPQILLSSCLPHYILLYSTWLSVHLSHMWGGYLYVYCPTVTNCNYALPHSSNISWGWQGQAGKGGLHIEDIRVGGRGGCMGFWGQKEMEVGRVLRTI